jgi:hypothetical protein
MEQKMSSKKDIKKLLKEIEEFKRLYDNPKTNYHQHELVNGLAFWLNRKLEDYKSEDYNVMIMGTQENMQTVPFYVELLDNFKFTWVTV